MVRTSFSIVQVAAVGVFIVACADGTIEPPSMETAEMVEVLTDSHGLDEPMETKLLMLPTATLDKPIEGPTSVTPGSHQWGAWSTHFTQTPHYLCWYWYHRPLADPSPTLVKTDFTPHQGFTYNTYTRAVEQGDPAFEVSVKVKAVGSGSGCDQSWHDEASLTVSVHNAAPTLTFAGTQPNPAVQYTPFELYIVGSGFDPATTEVLISYSDCFSPSCYWNTGGGWTGNQWNLVKYPITLSIPDTYNVRVRTGPDGMLSAVRTFTVVPWGSGE